MASKPGGRGGRKKFTNKGGNRHFSDFEQLKKQNEEIKREKAMQRDEEEDSDEDKPSKQTKPKVVNFDKVPKKNKTKGDDSSSSSSSEGGGESSSDADDEEDDRRAKGVSHLIDIDNPNRQVQKMKKIKDLKIDDETPEAASSGALPLNRKEREAVEAEKKRQDYLRLHAQGKTDEARADLARLAIIKKQREDAAKKREDERKAKEAAEANKTKDKLAGKH